VKWRGGDLVFVRFSDGTWEKGRVLRAPCEWREGRAVTVDCEDGFRRYVEPARLKPRLVVLEGGRARVRETGA
jgi:translation initiation factor IF-1